MVEPTAKKKRMPPSIDERRHVASVRNDAEGEDGRRRNQDRREEVHHLVGTRRHDVFLDQHLDPVGHRLEETERTDPIWPVAVLDAGENFSLQQRHESEEGEKDDEERDDIEQAGGNLPDPVGRAGEQRQEPLLSNHENLVEKTAHVAMKKSGVCFLKQDRNRVRTAESGRNAQRRSGLLMARWGMRLRENSPSVSSGLWHRFEVNYEFCFVPTCGTLFLLEQWPDTPRPATGYHDSLGEVGENQITAADCPKNYL